MTREEALQILDTIPTIGDQVDALELAIEALEQEPKFDRLYNWLNDMRLGIAPDETTPNDERRERQAKVDVLDVIMEWMVES